MSTLHEFSVALLRFVLLYVWSQGLCAPQFISMHSMSVGTFALYTSHSMGKHPNTIIVKALSALFFW